MKLILVVAFIILLAGFFIRSRRINRAGSRKAVEPSTPKGKGESSHDGTMIYYHHPGKGYQYYQLWQFFRLKTTIPAKLTAIEQKVSNQGDTPMNLQVELWSARQGVRIGKAVSILRTETLSPTWVVADFTSQGLTIEPDTEYWIKITATGGEIANVIGYRGARVIHSRGSINASKA